MHRRGVAGKRWRKRAQETKRLFKPNLQKATVAVGNEMVSMRICAKCLKRTKMVGTQS
jgi:ribosomal protein L28